MRPSSWLPFCLSLSCFRGGNKPDSTDKTQPTQTVGLGSIETTEALMPTDIWDRGYFTERGYALWTDSGVFKLFTERYGRHSLDPVVHLYVDVKHEAVTIYEDNLRRESPSRRALDIQQIYAALCSRAGIAPTRMQWIAMDVDDRLTAIMLRDHRIDNGLGLNDFYITPGQAGWETFSNNHFFQAAAKMIPGVEIDRIAVRKQQRGIQVPGSPLDEVQSLMFSFKQPGSEDHDASIDHIDENLLEINIKKNLDAIVKSAEHAILASSTNLFEGESKNDETAAEA